MKKYITIQIPDTEENKALIAQLIGIPGAIIRTGAHLIPDKKYVSLQEGAQIMDVHYLTFRKWVIEEKKIPYKRPSGSQQGSVRLLVKNIEEFMANRRKKTQDRGGVKII